MENLMDLYHDLRSDMPDNETVRKLTMGTGTHWELWNMDMENEKLSEAMEDLTPERMEALILDEEEIVEPEPGENDMELRARIIAVILYMLIILLLSMVFFILPRGTFGVLPSANPFNLLDALGPSKKG
jgi:hypothetical protein